ncbi:hypothetical protein [Telluribacter sp. SYSU D00476]|uniref:hypothetical protein n=1 Tax=Telluribacter sp. SYSU D00476 TaxID=2811430 RepID=UPI001FF30676|nr:hypothetical protein [Telluribacter sp. SYSU D00476]
MALEFQTIRIDFPSRRDAEQTINRSATFSRNIRSVGAAINGFNMRFSNGDHHLLQEKVDINEITFRDRTANFSVNLLLRDGSGHIDDPYSGFVDVLLIAETL